MNFFTILFTTCDRGAVERNFGEFSASLSNFFSHYLVSNSLWYASVAVLSSSKNLTELCHLCPWKGKLEPCLTTLAQEIYWVVQTRNASTVKTALNSVSAIVTNLSKMFDNLQNQRTFLSTLTRELIGIQAFPNRGEYETHVLRKCTMFLLFVWAQFVML